MTIGKQTVQDMFRENSIYGVEPVAYYQCKDGTRFDVESDAVKYQLLQTFTKWFSSSQNEILLSSSKDSASAVLTWLSKNKQNVYNLYKAKNKVDSTLLSILKELFIAFYENNTIKGIEAEAFYDWILANEEDLSEILPYVWCL